MSQELGELQPQSKPRTTGHYHWPLPPATTTGHYHWPLAVSRSGAHAPITPRPGNLAALLRGAGAMR